MLVLSSWRNIVCKKIIVADLIEISKKNCSDCTMIVDVMVTSAS